MKRYYIPMAIIAAFTVVIVSLVGLATFHNIEREKVAAEKTRQRQMARERYNEKYLCTTDVEVQTRIYEACRAIDGYGCSSDAKSLSLNCVERGTE